MPGGLPELPELQPVCNLNDVKENLVFYYPVGNIKFPMKCYKRCGIFFSRFLRWSFYAKMLRLFES